MKKRINTIDGKILVQGGTDNELKSNEIRVNADKTLTERVNGEIVNVGGSGGSGGGLRPVTADDFQTISLFSEMGYIDSPFINSIQVQGNTRLIIKLNNTKVDLVQPVKERYKLEYNEEQEFYIYFNDSQDMVVFNMSQLYIMEI